MWQEAKNFFFSSYGKLSAIVTAVALVVFVGWWALRPTNPVKMASVSSRFTQEKVRFNDDLTFSDSTGTRTEEPKPEDVDEVEQTVTIQDSTGRIRQLFVQKNESWFPEITGSPSAEIRGLRHSDVQGVTVVNQSPSLFGIDTDAILVGPAYAIGEGPSASLSYLPLRIWAFRFGPSAMYSINKNFSFQPAVGVKIRENLHLQVSATPDVVLGGNDKQGAVALLYEF